MNTTQLKHFPLAAATSLLPMLLPLCTASAAELEPVVVTAQKREQILQDVGLTVTAITAENIDALRIQVPHDINRFVANVDISEQIGFENPVVTIRGVGLNDFNANISPSVGVYVDEVFLASTAMLNFLVLDLDRIEVLKGPQGTLYGRNTTGGAISFITKLPGSEREGYVNATYGNYGKIEFEGAATTALSDRTSIRFAGKYANQDESYFTNPSRGRLDGHDTYALRAALRSQWTEDLEAIFSFQYGEYDGTNSLNNHVGVLGPNCNAIASGNPDPANCMDVVGYTDPTPDPFVTDIGDVDPPFIDVTTYSATARLNWSFGDNRLLTSITGYQYFDRSESEHSDANPFQLLTAIRNDEVEQLSQEFRINGQDGSLDWILGAFYSFDEIKSLHDFDLTFFAGTTGFSDIVQETSSAAIFADGRWALNDTVTLVGGIRFTWEEREFVGDTVLVGIGSLGSIDDSIDATEPSGRLGIEFMPTGDSLYYLSISNGFHSGGYFGSLNIPPDYGPFDKEEILAYEAGAKWTLAGGRVLLNTSVFYYDYNDIQTSVGKALGAGFDNIDGATVQGLDFEIEAQPLDGLFLRASVGLLDTELSAFVGPLLGPIPKGNVLPNAPEQTANALARYEFPLGDFTGSLQTDFRYSAEVARDAQNIAIATADSYSVWNARASISAPDDKWELALWCDNLADEEYARFIVFIAASQSSWQSMGAPRTYGATLSYRF